MKSFNVGLMEAIIIAAENHAPVVVEKYPVGKMNSGYAPEPAAIDEVFARPSGPPSNAGATISRNRPGLIEPIAV